MTNIISVNHLTVKLQNNTILSDITFSLKGGEILGLVGPSGCGKTTLLNTIAGFIEQETGAITIGHSGEITKENTLAPEKRNAGMIFQDYALFPHLSVSKNIGFGLDKLPKNEKSPKIDALLELLKLKNFEHRYPHQLSGGQQQRVAIARALAPEPKVLLLDEPFSNIDARLRNELMIEIRQLLKSLNMTAIFVTHNKDEVFTFADKIAVMNEGQLLQFGTPIQVSQQPNSWQVADFLQLGSWVPCRINEKFIETAVGSFPISEATDQSNVAHTSFLLIKPKAIEINPNGTPNTVVNHIGITEHGFHYIVHSCAEHTAKVLNEQTLSFKQLSFYHDAVFKIGQKLSVAIKPHEYLIF